MGSTAFWRDRLKTEFLKLDEKESQYRGEGALGALWDGHKWDLSPDPAHVCTNFERLAKSAAVRLGHDGEPTGVAFWLDLLKAKSGAYVPFEPAGRTWVKVIGRRSEGGRIELLCKVSAEYCVECETQEIVQQRAQAPIGDTAHQQQPPRDAPPPADPPATQASEPAPGADQPVKPQPADAAGSGEAAAFRASTVAKIIEELDVLKPQMLSESEYRELEGQHPSFLAFQVAKKRGDLKTKIINLREHRRHIRLAQELTAAYHGREWSTVKNDWKDHKPDKYKRKLN